MMMWFGNELLLKVPKSSESMIIYDCLTFPTTVQASGKRDKASDVYTALIQSHPNYIDGM